MATGRFKVTLTGQFDRARGRDDIRAALVELFKLSESEVDRLLDSAPVTIKSDLDYDTASRYKLAIEQTGALCEVREVDDHELRAAPTPAASTTLADVSPPSAPPPPPDTRASGGSTIGSVSPRRVEAGRGAAWWREGWALFMAAPGGWFAIGILMMLIMLVLEIIPVLGFIASLLLPPLLTGGVMFAAHEQHAGRPLSVTCSPGSRAAPGRCWRSAASTSARACSSSPWSARCWPARWRVPVPASAPAWKT